MIPKLAPSWTRIVEYPENHLNDFCIFRAPDDRWHCIGIMGTGTWASETSLFHCSSRDLYGPYQIHPPLLADLARGMTRNDAPQKHAPFVFVKRDTCFMFLRRPPGTNLLLKSNNPFHWPTEPDILFEENDARDACIQEFDGVYHWYYCQWYEVDGKGRSCIMLRRSQNLKDWDNASVVHVDTSREIRNSHLQSPFVIRATNHYWLFVRNRSMDDRCVTTIFRGDSPDRFASGISAWDFEFEGVHAAELVAANDQWHIARVSGTPGAYAGAPENGGWIEITSLSFDSREEFSESSVGSKD